MFVTIDGWFGDKEEEERKRKCSENGMLTTFVGDDPRAVCIKRAREGYGGRLGLWTQIYN